MEDQENKTVEQNNKEGVKQDFLDRLMPKKIRELDENTEEIIDKKSTKITYLIFFIALIICAIILPKYTIIAFEFIKKHILSYKTAHGIGLIFKIILHFFVVIIAITIVQLVVAILSLPVNAYLQCKFMYGSTKNTCIAYGIGLIRLIEGLLVLALIGYGFVKFMGWFVTTSAFSMLLKIIIGIVIVLAILFFLFKCEVVTTNLITGQEDRIPVWAHIVLMVVGMLLFFKLFDI